MSSGGKALLIIFGLLFLLGFITGYFFGRPARDAAKCETYSLADYGNGNVPKYCEGVK
jgi:hypothetical protein